MSRNMDDYVEVSERIEKFYEKYPEGSLRCKEIRSVQIGGDNFLVYVAQAFRTPDDQAPSEGAAWEPVPGKTNFTRDSELMNAETSAWGRAIAGLGFEVRRGIASANEVRNRRGSDDPPKSKPKDEASQPQKASITRRCKELGVGDEHKPLLIKWAGAKLDAPLTQGQAGKIVELLKGADDFAAVWKIAGLPNPNGTESQGPIVDTPTGPQTLDEAVSEPGGAEALGLTEADE